MESHPRSFHIVGTTNFVGGFLRAVTEHSSFCQVAVSGSGKCKPWQLSDVDQIWAEAIYRYKEGEELFLKGNIDIKARLAQKDAMEADEREGIVVDYLERLLPVNWDSMDLYERRGFLSNLGMDDRKVQGTVKREKVCIMEIWCECYFKERQDLRRVDTYEIEGILNRIGNWEKTSDTRTGKMRYSLYGPQRTFVRNDELLSN